MKEKKLSTFEKCKVIRNTLLITMGELMVYDSWSDKTKIKSINDIQNDLKVWLESVGATGIDPNKMTKKELKEIGFGLWHKESNLWLIPIWLYPFLVNDIKTVSIGGNEYTSKDQLDTDNRFGCLAYGIIPEKEE